MASDNGMKITPRVTTAFAQTALVLALAYPGFAHSQSTADPLAEARDLITAGRFARSEAWLHTYLSTHSASADAHFLLGYVLFREEKARESLAEFTAGAAVRRPKADEFKTIASDYVLLGAYSDADKWFTEVTSETPNDAETWYLLGRTKYNEGRYEECVVSFEHALALRPKDAKSENNLGLCHRELTQLKEAKTAFETAIEWQGQTPTDAQPFLNLGTLEADAGDWENAIGHLATAAALSPGNPKIHEQLGAAYQEHGDMSKAEAELTQAITLAPNSSGAHFKLAGLYRKEGKRDLAKREFDICARLNSTHSSSDTPNPYLPNSAAPK
jgi:Flp pilus assembly protein TadD